MGGYAAGWDVGCSVNQRPRGGSASGSRVWFLSDTDCWRKCSGGVPGAPPRNCRMEALRWPEERGPAQMPVFLGPLGAEPCPFLTLLILPRLVAWAVVPTW